MLVESVGASLLVSKLRGGKIRNLMDISLHKWWMIVTAALMEAAASYIRVKEIAPFWRWVDQHVLWLQILSYGLLIVAILFNIKKKGFAFILIGVLLNLIVIVANGGRMPVDITRIDATAFQEALRQLEMGKNLTHTVATVSTKLWFLGDIIHLQKPYPFPKSVSIGDLWMMAGIFLFIQQQIVKKE